jgi:predicted RNA-binding Zn-ribbon protein involved in translation (DUF1610 family)
MIDSTPVTDQVTLAHQCQDKQAVMIFPIPGDTEQVTDLKCPTCGRVMRLISCPISAHDYARLHEGGTHG